MNEMYEAIGPNFNDMGIGPHYGVFVGHYEDVVEWVDLLHPGFRAHLEGRKLPKAMLNPFEIKRITPEMIERLRHAIDSKEKANEELKRVRLELGIGEGELQI